jgi:DNA-binding transcriptional ArsR family regulator
VARAATTTDAFNALAEGRRRQIIGLLAHGERSVADLVELVGQAQPHVSRHLRVLREVGLVEVRDEGRHRVYRINPRPLREIHQWVSQYEQLWHERFDAMDDLLGTLDPERPPELDQTEEER